MRTKDIAEAPAGRLDGDGAIEIDRLVHPARAERPFDLALAISMVADHLCIGDEAVVAAGSGVAGNVAAGTFVSGYPAQPHQRTMEQLVYSSRQKRLHEKVDDLASRLDVMERTNKQ
jgi:UDP-3-O-[3-hydroxymyristoyl] glucosamine N-acyltransferase